MSNFKQDLREQIMRDVLTRMFFVVLFALGLTACGGGSTGGGGGTQNSPHVGTYTGTVNLTATAPGIPPVSGTDVVSVFIRTDGTVLIGDSENIFAVAPLNGDSFSITGDAAILADDTSCSGTITISGTVSNGVINGTISSNGVVCGGVPITFTGTFTGTRISTTVQGSSGILQGPNAGMSSAVRRLSVGN